MTAGIKNDSDKLQWWYLDEHWESLKEVVSVLMYGDTKYPADDGANWKRLDNPEKRFKDALLRHLIAYRQGEKNDPETGKSHLAHVITNALFLMHFDKTSKPEYDPVTIEKILDIIQDVKYNIHLSNSPYSDNESIVNPHLDQILNEIEYLKENKNG